MKRNSLTKRFPMMVLTVAAALLLCATQGFAVFGVWRRHARRAVVVGTSVAASSEESAAAKSSAAAQQTAAAETAAAQSAAAASQASAAAAQASAAKTAAPAAAAPAQKTPQQQLQELEALYKQGLITESDYNAAKAKILAQITQ